MEVNEESAAICIKRRQLRVRGEGPVIATGLFFACSKMIHKLA